MMSYPLTLTHLLERAQKYFSKTEVVSRVGDGCLHRQTWGETYRRTCQLARALRRLGVKPGDRVATLAWNHHQHLEAYYAIPMMGAVVHTLNLRLHPSELEYIARRAEDSIVLVDRSLLPLLDKFISRVATVRHVIVMADGAFHEDGKLGYEALISPESSDFDWPLLDENSAATICFTSGTTGRPKGVVYSHRSHVLHSILTALPDQCALSQRDVILPIVPMFHANCWGFAYSAALIGAKLVLPGPRLDAESLLQLMVDERVTYAAAVPTICLGILAQLDAVPNRWNLSALRQMSVGGSAAPPSMVDGFSRRHGVEILHGWGMTELNPTGTMAGIKKELDELTDADRFSCRTSQGYAVPFVELRHVDEGGVVLPWDGETVGELQARGPWVASSYMGNEDRDRWTIDGWFTTGDVVTIDAQGYVRVCDRAKDVIKSGGEWISSVAVENELMGHPAVLEAAVFAAKHWKWGERPIAAIVLKKGANASQAELAAHLTGVFAKFWIPDTFLFMDQIPRTSTGKFLKSALRERYGSTLDTFSDVLSNDRNEAKRAM
jgi:fatty-acyl-CoA synthase